MSENPDTGPTPDDVPAAEPVESSSRRSVRDRLSGLGERLRGTRGLIAATLAALIVGGLGGAAIHAAVDGDRDDHGRHFRDFGDRMGGGERPGPPRDLRHAPGGLPGQLPPTTIPEDSSPTPSESPSTSSNS